MTNVTCQPCASTWRFIVMARGVNGGWLVPLVSVCLFAYVDAWTKWRAGGELVCMKWIRHRSSLSCFVRADGPAHPLGRTCALLPTLRVQRIHLPREGRVTIISRACRVSDHAYLAADIHVPMLCCYTAALSWKKREGTTQYAYIVAYECRVAAMR